MNTALIVEDSLTERQAIADYLTRSGLVVSFATSGEEALEKVNLCPPDIVILDIILPGRSGFELCRHFKTNPQTHKLPIVLCSTKITELDRFWGLKQGADAYLPKPIAEEVLIRTVKQLLKTCLKEV
jgi:two-component system, chemotaxis family, response regulator PixH